MSLGFMNFVVMDTINDSRLINISAFITRTLYTLSCSLGKSQSDSEVLSCCIHPERPGSCTLLLTANTSVSSTVNAHPLSSPTFLSPLSFSDKSQQISSALLGPFAVQSSSTSEVQPCCIILTKFKPAGFASITPYKKSICGY